MRRWDAALTRVPPLIGLLVGVIAAALTFCIAVLRIAVLVVFAWFAADSDTVAESVRMAPGVLQLAGAAYFAGFPVAGALFAAASWIPWRILRYAATGALVFPTAFGAVAFIDGTFDGDGASRASYLLALTIIGSVSGAILGLMDRRRARTTSAGAA